MSDQSPLVTVYIPTYNRVDLLKRAVESVRNQTYTNLEIIIVDDCSTDNTQEYLKEISNLDQRIRYFIKEKNSGACVSRNIAIKNALGEYITGLDDDDYFLEKRIEIFVSNKIILENNKFIFSSVFYEKNNVLRKQGKIRLKKVNYNDMILMNHVGNQIFCKTETLRNSGGFKENLKAWQDWYCWMNLLKQGGQGIYLKSYTYVLDDNDHSRITNQNMSDKILNVYKIFIENFQLCKLDQYILSVNMIPYGVKVSFFKIFLVNPKHLSNFFKLWFWKRLFKNFLYFF